MDHYILDCLEFSSTDSRKQEYPDFSSINEVFLLMVGETILNKYYIMSQPGRL